jgi:hypothetical protein
LSSWSNFETVCFADGAEFSSRFDYNGTQNRICNLHRVIIPERDFMIFYVVFRDGGTMQFWDRQISFERDPLMQGVLLDRNAQIQDFSGSHNMILHRTFADCNKTSGFGEA